MELIGKLVYYKILSGIIPPHWKEYTYEYDNNYSIYVEGELLSTDEWNELIYSIKEEFGDRLMDIYTHNPNGIHFIVYLKK